MALPESGTIAVVAEKPSVARDIASVLGATQKATGICMATATWSRGPSAIWPRSRSRMKSGRSGRRWRRDLLPMLPRTGRWSSTKKPKISLRRCGRFWFRREVSTRHLRDGRRARRRTDLPLYL